MKSKSLKSLIANGFDSHTYLKSMRESGNISQVYLAKKLKVTSAFISQVESGKVAVPARRLTKWVQTLGGNDGDVNAVFMLEMRKRALEGLKKLSK